MESATAADDELVWYVPELVYFGNAFHKNIAILVNNATGTIDKVEKDSSRLKTKEIGTKVKYLQGKAILPGFINCHSHAFQIGLRGSGETYDARDENDSFWSWREKMYSLVQSSSKATFFKLVKQCFTEMRMSGITCVGEFNYFHHSKEHKDALYDLDRLLLQAAHEVGIRLVLLNAFYKWSGFGNKELNKVQKDHFETEDVESFWTNMNSLQNFICGASSTTTKRPTENQVTTTRPPIVASNIITLGVVAHSFRAVDTENFVSLHAEATRRKLPFHLHLEEQPAEVRACKQYHNEETPMELLLKLLPDSDLSLTTAVHCNHTLPHLLQTFTNRGGRVCICPLTEGNLGDGIMIDIAACQGRICLGTDCNARIDMLEEMRWLEYAQRLKRLQRGILVRASDKSTDTSNGETTVSNLVRQDCSHSQNDASTTETYTTSGPSSDGKDYRLDAPSDIFHYATRDGAQSLGVNAGEISEGKFADFALVDLTASVIVNKDPSSLLGTLIFGSGSAQVQ